MPLSLPFTFSPGTKAKSSEVNANFAAVQAKFSTGAGGIIDADCSTAMDLDFNKGSSTPGKRLISAKFEDDAVDLRILKDDPAPGAPLAAVNNANHIKDGIIQKRHLSTVALQKITLAQLDILVEQVSFSLFLSSPSVLRTVWVYRETSGANYIAHVNAFSQSGGGTIFQDDNTFAPTTPIPFASRNLIGLFLADITFTLGAVNGKIVFVSMPLT